MRLAAPPTAKVYVTVSAALATQSESARDVRKALRTITDQNNDGRPDGGDTLVIDTRDPTAIPASTST